MPDEQQTPPPTDPTSLTDEITDLETRLAAAKARRAALLTNNPPPTPPSTTLTTTLPPDLHPLLLLSDSSLPLGSFAFSSSLESYLAHRPSPRATSTDFSRFLPLSLASVAGATLPYVRAAHARPARLRELDDEVDASTPCVVARRASVAQGRALVGVWERSLRGGFGGARGGGGELGEAREALEGFVGEMKEADTDADGTREGEVWRPHGHLPPLFGVLGKCVDVPLGHLLYIYLLNHAKTLVSAGVRASVLGPYQAQGILASEALRGTIWALVGLELKGEMEDGGWVDVGRAGQNVPMLDIWGGRHEMLYSRIFNS